MVLPRRNICIQQVVHNRNRIFITTVERTLVDCLRRLKYSGGFAELYQSYRNVPYINWQKIKIATKAFELPILYARTGFFLELFRKRWEISESFMNNLRKKAPKQPDYLLGSYQPDSQLIKKWNLYVPKEIIIGTKYNV